MTHSATPSKHTHDMQQPPLYALSKHILPCLQVRQHWSWASFPRKNEEQMVLAWELVALRLVKLYENVLQFSRQCATKYWMHEGWIKSRQRRATETETKAEDTAVQWLLMGCWYCCWWLVAPLPKMMWCSGLERCVYSLCVHKGISDYSDQ